MVGWLGPWLLGLPPEPKVRPQENWARKADAGGCLRHKRTLQAHDEPQAAEGAADWTALYASGLCTAAAPLGSPGWPPLPP